MISQPRLLDNGLWLREACASTNCMCVCARVCSHSSTYIEVNNFQEERMIYDVIATIYGTVEPGNSVYMYMTCAAIPCRNQTVAFLLQLCIVYEPGLHRYSALKTVIRSKYAIFDFYLGLPHVVLIFAVAIEVGVHVLTVNSTLSGLL